MLILEDVLKSFINSGLNVSNLIEITGITESYLRRYYPQAFVPKTLKPSPSERDVTIAILLMSNMDNIDFSRVLEICSECDPNILYSRIKEHGVNIQFNVSELLSYDCQCLLNEGLSFRNLSLLCAEFTNGIAPDFASLRRRIIRDGYELSKDDSKAEMPVSEKAICLEMCKSWSLKGLYIKLCKCD